MARFRYRGLTAQGAQTSGEVEAVDLSDALGQARAEGVIPFNAELVGERGARPARFSPQRLARLTERLAAFAEAALPLDEALALLAAAEPHPKRRETLWAVHDSVQSGASLADAFGERNAAFPAYFVAVVRAGETAGALPQALASLAGSLERAEATAERIRGSLIYPLILLATAFAAVVIVLFAVVPGLSPLFAHADDAMSGATRALFGASAFLRAHGALLAVGIGTGALVGAWALRRPQAKRARDRALMLSPILGGVVRRLETARIAQLAGMLLRAGAPLTSALAAAREAARNDGVADALSRAEDDVRQGGSLATALANETAFAPETGPFVAMGERTGDLAGAFERLAHLSARDAETAADRALAVLTPALTLFIGALVGGLILTVLSAVMSINELAF